MCKFFSCLQSAGSEDQKVLAHCASGVGRTGIFAYFLSLVFNEPFFKELNTLLNNQNDTDHEYPVNSIDVLVNTFQNTLNKIRSHRHSLQTPEQMIAAVINVFMFLVLNKLLLKNNRKLFGETQHFDFAYFETIKISQKEKMKEYYDEFMKMLIIASNRIDYFYSFNLKSKGILDLARSLVFQVVVPESLVSSLETLINFLKTRAAFEIEAGDENKRQFSEIINRLVEKYALSQYIKDRTYLSKWRTLVTALLDYDAGNAEISGILKELSIILSNQIEYVRYEDSLSQIILHLANSSSQLFFAKGFQRVRSIVTDPSSFQKKFFNAHMFFPIYCFFLYDFFVRPVYSKNNVIPNLFNSFYKNYYGLDLILTGKKSDNRLIISELSTRMPREALGHEDGFQKMRAFLLKLLLKIENIEGLLIPATKLDYSKTNSVRSFSTIFNARNNFVLKCKEFIWDLVYIMTIIIFEDKSTPETFIEESFTRAHLESNFLKTVSSDQITSFLDNLKQFCVENFKLNSEVREATSSGYSSSAGG